MDTITVRNQKMLVMAVAILGLVVSILLITQ